MSKPLTEDWFLIRQEVGDLGNADVDFKTWCVGLPCVRGDLLGVLDFFLSVPGRDSSTSSTARTVQHGPEQFKSTGLFIA